MSESEDVRWEWRSGKQREYAGDGERDAPQKVASLRRVRLAPTVFEERGDDLVTLSLPVLRPPLRMVGIATHGGWQGACLSHAGQGGRAGQGHGFGSGHGTRSARSLSSRLHSKAWQPAETRPTDECETNMAQKNAATSVFESSGCAPPGALQTAPSLQTRFQVEQRRRDAVLQSGRFEGCLRGLTGAESNEVFTSNEVLAGLRGVCQPVSNKRCIE